MELEDGQLGFVVAHGGLFRIAGGRMPDARFTMHDSGGIGQFSLGRD